MVKEVELSEEERKALRGSKFAPLSPPSSSSKSQHPRLAHPGGPLKTNKAAALAKFLQRKLQDPNGLSSINPDLVELAVQNAKRSVSSGGVSSSGTIIHHVTSFGDSDLEDSAEEGKVENVSVNKQKKKKKKRQKKNKKPKMVDGGEDVKLKTPKKKPKL